MKIITDEKKIDEVLSRGVDKIYPSKEALREVLSSGKRLRLYQGFDPTADKLHIGHMVGLLKHKQWQDMGHEVIFLIGDGTGEAGDPSGKKKTREKFFTSEELRENAKNYLTQASKIIHFDGTNPIKLLYNGDWLNKLTKRDILNIAQNFSVQQLIERDMFQERIKNGEEINMREFLYPLLQAYDSVAMDVDLELGGSDQTFNMLAGRTLMKKMKSKEKFVMTMPLIADKSGNKIGKSEGNMIALTDEPEKIFGAVMAFPDEVVIQCFECLTDVPMEEAKKEKNPMANKKRLAFEIVKELYDKSQAEKAQDNWSNTFQKKEIPDAEEVEGDGLLMPILLKNKFVASNSEARRLFEAGAIKDMTDDKKMSGTDFVTKSHVYKIGKHRFIKIK
ncbi:MAG: tyrosine--tRNA ligase [bacterium]